jgi:DNA-binding LytR/AlgR family response regulator
MLTAIAIDDEPMALEVIKSHAAKVPFLHLTDVFTNAIKALEHIKLAPVDLIFLDIKMPDISGIELATLVPEKTMLVFTTAYSEHAVKGFELDATDYLLKPFALGRFLQACQKAQEWQTLRNTQDNRFIFVKTGYEQVKVNFDTLLYCEAQGNYVSFHLAEELIVSRMTLSETEKLLPPTFVKSHRSFLANLAHIQKVERHQLTVKGKTIPVSSTYYESLMTEIARSNP